MFRYRLRTLVIATGFLPALLAGFWYVATNRPFVLLLGGVFSLLWLALVWMIDDCRKALRKLK